MLEYLSVFCPIVRNVVSSGEGLNAVYDVVHFVEYNAQRQQQLLQPRDPLRLFERICADDIVGGVVGVHKGEYEF